MPRGVIVAAALLGALAMFADRSAQAQGPAKPTNLKTFDFVLEGVQYRIQLPAHATLMPGSGTDRFHVSLSTRAIRQMELRPTSGETSTTYPRSQSLANGARVSFKIIRDPGGPAGSGGPEETLEGQLQIGGRMLLVRCDDQAEWPGYPRPDWCIDYLQHLAVADGR